jgi:hypothetical protein
MPPLDGSHQPRAAHKLAPHSGKPTPHHEPEHPPTLMERISGHPPTLMERISGGVPGTPQDPTFWERVGGAAPFSMLGAMTSLLASHRGPLSAALAFSATGPLGMLLSVIGLAAYASMVVPLLAAAAALAAFLLVLFSAPPQLLRAVYLSLADLAPVADRIKIASMHALNGERRGLSLRAAQNPFRIH